MKWVLLAGVVFIVAINIKSCKSCLEGFDRVTQSFEQRQELKHIADAIEREYIVSETVPTDDFLGFVKQQMTRGASKRDVRKDCWGTFLRLQTGDGYIVVVSAGADKRFGTGDDVKAKKSLPRYRGGRTPSGNSNDPLAKYGQRPAPAPAGRGGMQWRLK